MNKIAIFLSPFMLVGMIFLFASQALADNSLTLAENGLYDPATGSINYTLSWSFASSTLLSNLTISNNIPLGTTFVSLDKGGVVASGGINWNVGPQNGPATGSVGFTVSVDAAQALNPRIPPLYPLSCGIMSQATATGTVLSPANIVTATITNRMDLVSGCNYGGSGSGGSGIPGVSGISGITNGGGPPNPGSSNIGGSSSGGGLPSTNSTSTNPSGNGVAPQMPPQVLGASTPTLSLPRTGLPEWVLLVVLTLSVSLTFIYRKVYG